MKPVEAVPDLWTVRGFLWKPVRGRCVYSKTLQVDDIAFDTRFTQGLHSALIQQFTRLRAHFSGAVIKGDLFARSSR